MKAVLDTNVVGSGLFFGGVPCAILDLVADGSFELLLFRATRDEYQRIYARLATGHPELEARHPYLFNASGWAGVQVLTPRAFMDQLTKGT